MIFQTVGIIGAGTMGNGIAQVCAVAGLAVTMVDVSAAAIKGGLDSINRSLDRLVTKGNLKAEGKRAALERIRGTEGYDDLRDVELVVEAATENPELKLRILKRLDLVMSP